MKICSVFVATAWVAMSTFASAQRRPATAKRPMRFADLMAMKRVSDPQISPSGKWVMFSVTDVSPAANTKVNHLWVGDWCDQWTHTNAFAGAHASSEKKAER